ncbi:MAG: carbonic anhydrase [Chlamydiae bacterium]|nr:carbonic anhydrase [Chlamydiota bacterium]
MLKEDASNASNSSVLEKVSMGAGLCRLMEGNRRYVNDALVHPNRTPERRESVVCLQEPFAIIVGCSDSRVSPEILFDQGVGDLFVVRVAGNVVGPVELTSIEFAATYLHCKVILVLGHENCGAVRAVLDGQSHAIQPVAQFIEPSVEEAQKTNPENLWECSVKTNALRMKSLLLQSSVIQSLLQQDKIEVHAAYYNLQTGAVEILFRE